MGPSQDRVTGIILAAGESRRLGRPKQLLDIGGEPCVRRVARIALQTDIDDVIVVIGAAADQIGPYLDDLDVGVSLNPRFRDGQATSVTAGLRVVPDSTAGVLFLLGDQPTIEPGTVDAVIREWDLSETPIVQGRYRGAVGHPVLVARSLFDELRALTGDQGARTVIRKHLADVRYVDVDAEPPPDIDTEDDYQRVLALLSRVGDQSRS
jgi:molybdenum cofactor cytidylyltransferase